MMNSTMKMKTRRRMMRINEFFAACCAASLLFSGCRQAEISAAERADRASRSYSAAMAELQAGRVDSAIERFKEVVRAEPGNGNAHFQLAALLEEVKKDYLSAIIHYRLYCLIRPDSEKAAVALDRMKGCETRYAVDAMTKAGIESKVSAELKALQEEHLLCGKKTAKIADDLEMANRRIAALEKTIEMKNRMLDMAQSIKDKPDVAAKPKKLVRPTDEQLLNDDDSGSARISSDEIKNLRAMLDEDERSAKQPFAPAENAHSGTGAVPLALSGQGEKAKDEPKRQIPETYTVEEGDTLMRISAKFYGTNRKWREIRDANRTVISSAGRVRAGQVIKLP
jgi:nucleoid-associated protein YgaU